MRVLLLDTQFPRSAGDVGCPDTYWEELEIIRIPKATVSEIVTSRPESVDLGPFAEAIVNASGDVITTSCGFLSRIHPLLDRRNILNAIKMLLFASGLVELRQQRLRFVRL